MTHRLLIYLLLLAVTVLCALPPAIASTGDASLGKPIYERLCVSCHGANGQGGPMARMLSTPPRNLADRTYMDTRSNQQLFDVIKQGGAATGLSPDMRAFGEQLTDQEIWDTIAYLRTLTIPPAIPSPPLAAAPSGKEVPGTDLRLAHLRLSIWPEYDDPRVLVILRGEAAPGIKPPILLSLPIPKDAEIIGAGMVSEREELLLQPHQLIPGEGQDRLELNLPVARFFIEFYYNPFTGEADKRFTFTLPTVYAIERLEVAIQQPLEATNFVITPQPARHGQDERGFTYHWFFYQNVARGQTLNFNVSYTKLTTAPSVAKRQPEPAAVDQRQLTTDPILIAFGLLVGAAVLFGGTAWLWKGYQGRRRVASVNQSSPPLPIQTHPTGSDVTPPPGAGTVNFCSNCGRRLQASYHFCPGCGKRLRAEGDK